MENERAQRFIFPQTLTEQGGLLPLPNDEATVLVGPITWGFYDGQYLVGLVVGVLLWYALRHFKKGRGSQWLLNACYWYLPAYCTKSFYKTLSESAFRLYLK
ncbi:type IV conjugative transfer system protein TraL [Providencia alcalifaciens]|uniref:type IV conjugative transfer system protein TraL n=1 Tax=Providencia alcalifaciens TaxID=126385 RepID=UPI00044C7A97|nr:type IV conjugative transfer system protein TraL [Providencia alcalifaciens]ETT04904.1 type IV conjugative transfer system protein TraL [Providencia alcalifaciens F90-2004]EUC94241.1 type IV conjugative transfer system protein TraL [Providencia alcalifaciens PAL-2]MTB32719.1 type IV conjugative transfer system protein TraL [Providencia alcalifaciens]CAG9435602.1 hypothetical protein NVI2019_PEGOAJLN_03760 [Providencia alcalifaciens]CAG9435629.1 hypothetical protein NVI2019_OGMBKCAO_03935 [P